MMKIDYESFERKRPCYEFFMSFNFEMLDVEKIQIKKFQNLLDSYPSITTKSGVVFLTEWAYL